MACMGLQQQAITFSYYIRGQRSRARFKRDKTRRDWQTLPELAVPGPDYFFLVMLSGKIREKSGKKWGETGIVNTPRESLKQYQILILFPEHFKKQYQLRLFLVGTVNIT